MSRATAHHVIVFLATALHRLYKITLSPLFGDACRYTPYCSDYALEAIKVHGITAGSWLAVKRVCRCHPWRAGGWDPVPSKVTNKGLSAQ